MLRSSNLTPGLRRNARFMFFLLLKKFVKISNHHLTLLFRHTVNFLMDANSTASTKAPPKMLTATSSSIFSWLWFLYISKVLPHSPCTFSSEPFSAYVNHCNLRGGPKIQVADNVFLSDPGPIIVYPSR